MSINEERISTAMQWILFGSFASFSTVVVALALQSIDPLLYAFVPSQVITLVGLIKCKDEELKGVIHAFAISILLGASAAGMQFGLHDTTNATICQIFSFAILASPLVSWIIRAQFPQND